MGKFIRTLERRARLAEAESAGLVADSMEVRLALMAQFHSGEKTLEAVQEELQRIKRSAKKIGKVTRNQAYLGRGPRK